MKSILVLAAGLLIFSSCATTKMSKSPSPTGDWDYSVTGTPEGDFTGLMTIAQVEQKYTAKFKLSGYDTNLDKFLYDSKTKKMTGEFYYSGTLVIFTGLLEGDAISGSMSAGGSDYPFKATRKK
jgi:hypothetical protein